MKETDRTPKDIRDNPLYKAFAGGDNNLPLCLIAVEYLEKRFTSIEVKIEDDYLAEKISREVMKNNNELYRKFSDEMRGQSKEFNDAMREQNEKSNDAMREQNEKSNDAMQAQSEKFSDEMREQNKEFNDAMRAENDKLNSKLQMHTYWTVGTILATGAMIVAFLQL